MFAGGEPWKDMKTIVYIVALGSLMVVGSGCESDRHEHHEYHGGAYDREYHHYGHGEYERYPGDGHYYDAK
jgi:hypothetical protein